MSIRVFVISNHRLAIWALAELFAKQSHRFLLTGLADSFVHPAIDTLSGLAPQVALLDIDSDPEQVLPIIAKLRAARDDLKIILLTRLNDQTLQDRAIIAGAHGVLDASSEPDQILSAIEKVAEGQIWLDRSATARIFVEMSRAGSKPSETIAVDHFSALTEREREVVFFIASNSAEPGKVVAKQLRISESTLRNHLTTIYEKLGVANRGDLLAYAFRNEFSKALRKS